MHPLALQVLSHMWGGFQTLPLQTAHSRVFTATPALTTKVQGIILVKLKFARFPSKRDGHSRSRTIGLSRRRTTISYQAGNSPFDLRKKRNLERPASSTARALPTMSTSGVPTQHTGGVRCDQREIVEDLNDGAGRDLPSREERPQPCSGDGSCYRGQNYF